MVKLVGLPYSASTQLYQLLEWQGGSSGGVLLAVLRWLVRVEEVRLDYAYFLLLSHRILYWRRVRQLRYRS